MSRPVNKLKDCREKKLFTQEDLAEKSGVNRGVISKAECGGRISLGSIKKLAEALNCSPDKLL